MKKLVTKASSFQMTESSDEDMVVKGYASVFDNVDSDNDVIKKGSFKRSIKSWGPEGKNRIKLVSQHDISKPVAKITVLKEDETGLYMEATFGTHTDGVDHYKMVKEGILTEFSIGFVPMKYKENKSDGIDIDEIKLYEVSLVTVASNEEAIVTDVKASELLEEAQEVAKDAGLHEVEVLLLKLANAFDIATPPVAKTQDPVEEVKSAETLLIELAAKMKANS